MCMPAVIHVRSPSCCGTPGERNRSRSRASDRAIWAKLINAPEHEQGNRDRVIVIVVRCRLRPKVSEDDAREVHSITLDRSRSTSPGSPRKGFEQIVEYSRPSLQALIVVLVVHADPSDQRIDACRFGALELLSFRSMS